MADEALCCEVKKAFPISQLVNWLARELPGLELVCSIKEGWSSDYKLKLMGSDGARYLLRYSREVPRQRRTCQAEAMLKASSSGLLSTLPVKFGELEEGGSFILQTWLDGVELEAILPSSSPYDNYSLGRLAGRSLRSLHEASKSPPTDFAYIKAARRIERHVEGYLRSGFSETWEKDASGVIRDTVCLLRSRPVCLRHGDYHPGNMIIAEDGKLGIIDFDRCDFGDPFDEFYKAEMFSRQLSVDFVNGQIHEYFEGDPPDGFWKVLKLYLADVILYSLVWALPFGEAEVEGMRDRARMVLSDFDSFRASRPLWYRKA